MIMLLLSGWWGAISMKKIIFNVQGDIFKLHKVLIPIHNPLK